MTSYRATLIGAVATLALVAAQSTRTVDDDRHHSQAFKGPYSSMMETPTEQQKAAIEAVGMHYMPPLKAHAGVADPAHAAEMSCVILFLVAILSLGVLSATGAIKLKEAPQGGWDKQILHDNDMIARFALFVIWTILSAVQLFATSTTRMEVLFGAPFVVAIFNVLAVALGDQITVVRLNVSKRVQSSLSRSQRFQGALAGGAIFAAFYGGRAMCLTTFGVFPCAVLLMLVNPFLIFSQLHLLKTRWSLVFTGFILAAVALALLFVTAIAAFPESAWWTSRPAFHIYLACAAFFSFMMACGIAHAIAHPPPATKKPSLRTVAGIPDSPANPESDSDRARGLFVPRSVFLASTEADRSTPGSNLSTAPDGTMPVLLSFLMLGMVVTREWQVFTSFPAGIMVSAIAMPVLAGFSQHVKCVYVDKALVNAGTSRLTWCCLQIGTAFICLLFQCIFDLNALTGMILALSLIGILVRIMYEFVWQGALVKPFKWFGQFTKEIPTSISGFTWLVDKARLLMSVDGELAERILPPTYLVHDGGLMPLGNTPDRIPRELYGRPWFLKNAAADGGRDNHVFASPTAAIEYTMADGHTRKRYVLQPQWPLTTFLLDGHKFHLRTHILLVTRDDEHSGGPNQQPFMIFWQNDGLLRLAHESFAEGTTQRSRQLTNDSVDGQSAFHQRLLSKTTELTKLGCVDAISDILTEVFRVASKKVLCGGVLTEVSESEGYEGPTTSWTKNGQMILGADFLFDETGRPWLMEFNREPFFHPRFFTPAIWKEMYLPMQKDIQEMASVPLKLNLPSSPTGGWVRLNVDDANHRLED